jgi:NADPH:quinone reductase-like Zn-dependent oxidoreductase
VFSIGIAGAGADLAKSLGCDAVVDYRKPTVIADIAAAITASGHTFSAAFDAHANTTGDTTSYAALGSLMQPAGGAVTTVLPLDENAVKTLPPNVKFDGWTMVGSAHDMTQQGDFAKRWFRQLGKWLGEGKFKPNVVKVIPGGLAGVREGLRLLEENKVSGEKMVCECSSEKLMSVILG